jgi:hypothetical protein
MEKKMVIIHQPYSPEDLDP